jgi:hypothetical protein
VASVSELSCEAAIRALDLQERSIDQLRGRAGTVLVAASVTASFLGAQTIQQADGLGVLGGFALVSLVSSICLSVYVLLPKEGFVFSLNAARVFEELYGLDPEEAERRLIYWLEGYWKENNEKLETLGQYFFAASLALILQLVFWSWAFAATMS